jgi:hypothetical protein
LEVDAANPTLIMTEPGIGYRMEMAANKLPQAA